MAKTAFIRRVLGRPRSGGGPDPGRVDDRHPRRGPARTDARDGRPGARLPGGDPRPGPGLPGRRDRRPAGRGRLRRHDGGARAGGRLRGRHLRAGARLRPARRGARRAPARPPGAFALRTTQDRLAERRFLESIFAPTAPWREIRTQAELEAGALALGMPLRLKAAIGGYDGRSQVRIAEPDGPEASRPLGRARGARRAVRAAARAGARLRARAVGRRRRATWPGAPSPSRRRRTATIAGILVESVAPAPSPVERGRGRGGDRAGGAHRHGARPRRHPDRRAVPPARRLARRQRARAAGPQQRPLDDRGRGDQPVRAAHPGDLRPAARVARTPTARPRWSTCSAAGRGARRTWSASRRPWPIPLAHLHVYDKREVFERRKMGHLTVVAPTADEALQRARAAAARLSWG